MNNIPILILILAALIPNKSTAAPAAGVDRFVHFMHIDGLRPDVMKTMVDAGQLPHFSLLLQRGKISYETATVDKTETMKVIQSYLTSTHDTYVTGWWQFNRENREFFNCDTSLFGLPHFSLGLTFPNYPTIYDLISADQKSLAVGFGLHRRSVPFENYSRNYVEAAGGVLHHDYYKQADATMRSLTQLLERMARNSHEKLPTFTTSLIAPVDEYSHWKGIVATSGDPDYTWQGDEACFTRKPQSLSPLSRDDFHENFFDLWDEGGRNTMYPIVKDLKSKYFSSYREEERRVLPLLRRQKRLVQFCIRVPKIHTFAWPSTSQSDGLGSATTEKLTPDVALAMIQVDMELGRLIQTLRQIRISGNEKSYVNLPSPGITNYQFSAPEGSMFEKTLFVFMGDHGFGDTKHTVSKKDPSHPDLFSARDHIPTIDMPFIQHLNQSLNLTTPNKEVLSHDDTSLIGIDDGIQPQQIRFMFLDRSWLHQNPNVAGKVQEAEQFVESLGIDLLASSTDLLSRTPALRNAANLALSKIVSNIFGKLSGGATGPAADFTPENVKKLLIHLYLMGDPEYMAAESQQRLRFFDKHVRLIYGGAARSNAEIFIPSPTNAGTLSWNHRPTYDQILDYKPHSGSSKTLLQALADSPPVGLIFVREGADQLGQTRQLPHEMKIHVFDRFSNHGIIRVRREQTHAKLIFNYRRISERDPLGVGSFSEGDGTTGSYQDWNEWGIRQGFYYQNVVGGIGSYLYSINPNIGDLTLMRSQGWNFGDNGASHGGVHREEKLTAMMISGPGITPGQLLTQSKFTYRNGVIEKTPQKTFPTVLDMAPTTLNWLGYGPHALEHFARNGFETQYRNWLSQQREVVVNVAVSGLQSLENTRIVGSGRTEVMKTKLRRLLKFMPDSPTGLENLSNHKVDGVVLDLDR